MLTSHVTIIKLPKPRRPHRHGAVTTRQVLSFTFPHLVSFISIGSRLGPRIALSHHISWGPSSWGHFSSSPVFHDLGIWKSAACVVRGALPPLGLSDICSELGRWDAFLASAPQKSVGAPSEHQWGVHGAMCLIHGDINWIPCHTFCFSGWFPCLHLHVDRSI